MRNLIVTLIAVTGLVSFMILKQSNKEPFNPDQLPDDYMYSLTIEEIQQIPVQEFDQHWNERLYYKNHIEVDLHSIYKIPSYIPEKQ